MALSRLRGQLFNEQFRFGIIQPGVSPTDDRVVALWSARISPGSRCNDTDLYIVPWAFRITPLAADEATTWKTEGMGGWGRGDQFLQRQNSFSWKKSREREREREREKRVDSLWITTLIELAASRWSFTTAEITRQDKFLIKLTVAKKVFSLGTN